MIKIAQLYKRAELEIPVSRWAKHETGTDGKNIYRYVLTEGVDGELIVYKFSQDSNYKQCSVIYRSPIERFSRVKHYYYDEKTDKMYIVASCYSLAFEGPITLLLIRDGVICDKQEIGGGVISPLFQCRRGDYYSNLIMVSVVRDNSILEHYIDSETNTIQKKLHVLSLNVNQILEKIFSTDSEIYIVTVRDIIIVNRFTSHVRTISINMRITNVKLSTDAKYLWARTPKMAAIYRFPSFEQVLSMDQDHDVLGLVNGFIVNHSYKSGLSEMVYRNGHPYAVVSGGVHNDLGVCPTKSGVLWSPCRCKNESSCVAIYDFIWRWDSFKLQNRRVQREAVYVYMILSRRIGFCHYLALDIAAMVMTA